MCASVCVHVNVCVLWLDEMAAAAEAVEGGVGDQEK